ncbi:MAG: ABC transporter permease subunit [Caldilineaceae bacterium]
MLSTFQGLILVYVAYSLPFSVFFMTGFFRTLPSELHEAAIIDGANQYQVFPHYTAAQPA